MLISSQLAIVIAIHNVCIRLRMQILCERVRLVHRIIFPTGSCHYLILFQPSTNGFHLIAWNRILQLNAKSVNWEQSKKHQFVTLICQHNYFFFCHFERLETLFSYNKSLINKKWTEREEKDGNFHFFKWCKSFKINSIFSAFCSSLYFNLACVNDEKKVTHFTCSLNGIVWVTKISSSLLSHISTFSSQTFFSMKNFLKSQYLI